MIDASRMMCVIEALEPLLLAYPKSGMTAKSIEVYAAALSDVDDVLLKLAVIRCIQERVFFPSVAEIRTQAQLLAEAVEGKRALTPGEAWKDAMDCAKRYDMTGPRFATPEVERAAKIYGWRELRMVLEKDVGVARAQFMRIYEGVLARKREVEISEKLLETRVLADEGHE